MSTAPSASPDVVALARRLNVDLDIVSPSGLDGTITSGDVERVHRILREVGPLEPLAGPRRAMAHDMVLSRDQVIMNTLHDDAVISGWTSDQEPMLRLIRAMVAAAKQEPALNAWYDGVQVGRRVIDKVHLGVAVDVPGGTQVCVMQDVGARTPESLKRGLQRMREDTRAGRVPAEELRGYTITLSNMGRGGPRYGTPAIVPPTVAIVLAGSVRDAVVPVDGKPAVARVLPLSLSFDHRAVTGGEAGRFLAAMMKDLQAVS